MTQPATHHSTFTQTAQPGDSFVEEGASLPAWLQAAFPWASSFLLHTGFFLLLVFTLFAVNRATRDDRVEIFIAPTTIGSPDDLPPVPHPGLGPDRTRPPAQEDFRDVVDMRGWAPREGPVTAASLLAGNASDAVSAAILRGGGATIGGLGIGGTGDGNTGKLAPWGPRGGGGDGPGGKGPFIATQATRIVYILDNSGSMIDVFDYLRRDVKTSVNRLIPVQQFGVVVFSEQAVTLTNMNRAFDETKRNLAAKIDTVVAHGENDYQFTPFRDAFAQAFAMKPQLIYFLTDGAFDPKLIDYLNTANKDRAVRINTIAFLSSEENAEFLQLYEQLKTIAKDHHGRFRKVTAQDMVGE